MLRPSFALALLLIVLGTVVLGCASESFPGLAYETPAGHQLEDGDTQDAIGSTQLEVLRVDAEKFCSSPRLIPDSYVLREPDTPPPRGSVG